MTYNTKFHCH